MTSNQHTDHKSDKQSMNMNIQTLKTISWLTFNTIYYSFIKTITTFVNVYVWTLCDFKNVDVKNK